MNEDAIQAFLFRYTKAATLFRFSDPFAQFDLFHSLEHGLLCELVVVGMLLGAAIGHRVIPGGFGEATLIMLDEPVHKSSL